MAYHFFKNREAPEKPAEVFAAKRAQPSERRVRTKINSRGEYVKAVLVDEEKEGSVDLESKTELGCSGVSDEMLSKEGSAETKKAVQTKVRADNARDGDGPGRGENTQRTRPIGGVPNSSEQPVMG